MNINIAIFSLLIIFTCSSALTRAADFDIPSISRCTTDMAPANTNDSKVYNIHSDFYYEFEDKRDYAAEALTQMVAQFAPEGSACQQFSQPMNRKSITCNHFAGSDVCIVPSDSGEFIVVKDFVDSTNIVLTRYSKDYRRFPNIDSDNDQQTLWLPMPGLCYDPLLDNLFDSQSYRLEGAPYLGFGDFRYLLARTSRDLVQNLAAEHTSCSYQTSGHLASEMQCLIRKNKPAICAQPSTNGGYFVFVTDDNNSVHILFNRWD